MRQTTQHTQQTLAESFSKHAPYDKASKRWQDITNAIANFIAKEMMAIQVVESEGFRQLNILDPRYEVPSRKYFGQTALPNLYESTRKTLTEKLQKCVTLFYNHDL